MADYISLYTGSQIDSGIGKANTAVQPADLESKQDTLVSGTNIKTINGQNILGSGNITIPGGSGGGNTADPVLSNSAFEITDEEDNVLFAVTNQGHIKTKKFDS